MLKELKYALARDEGDLVEALTVYINVRQMKILCLTAYGPQENDSKQKNMAIC